MVPSKSQEVPLRVIAALLRSVQSLHSEVFSPRSCRLTIQKIARRLDREGIGFLTKTLPRLGKALDRALASSDPIDCGKERKFPHAKFPKLFGELFGRVLGSDGRVLPAPCVASIKSLRDITYLFYKYELPYSVDQEESVIARFIACEDEVRLQNERLAHIASELNTHMSDRLRSFGGDQYAVVRRARILLNKVLSRFDPMNIVPRHGPGAVSTGERLWGKLRWSDIPDRVLASYPLDYFYCSLGHMCDRLQETQSLGNKETPARVILVPKDSRGPRLISCEPLYLQWIQQGISRALVQHVERHPLTRGRVNFTDQSVNRDLARQGSVHGHFCTLDLNEASDRVSIGLIDLLFPEWFTTILKNTRSQSTQLPDGTIVPLEKFAPMGSALCFPILALSVWAILHASALDADARKCIYVYGDDVIVLKGNTQNAIEQLELFGLKVNRDKSCTSGLFRESCGMDAYQGVDVTPVRIRTVWSSRPSPDVYSSWISYANSLWKKRYYQAYDEVVELLGTVYPVIPSEDMHLACPSLLGEAVLHRPIRKRYNNNLQKLEYHVPVIESRPIQREVDGWMMLLRFMTEGHRPLPNTSAGSFVTTQEQCGVASLQPFTVSSYTKRKASKLVYRWR